MRVHVLGVSHSKTSKEYSADAFSQKARLICKLLTLRGHHVTHYGTEGSDPVCAENVIVLDDATFRQTHDYDWRAGAFNDRYETPANLAFVANAQIEMAKRVRKHDIVCVTYGLNHKPITDTLKQAIVVESGIGYEHTYAPHRVFESYAWMHFLYGKEGKNLNPPLYDAVIPNYYDLDDYPTRPYNGLRDYFFMVSRPTSLKGWEIASLAAKASGYSLVTAGQGRPPVESEHVGVVSIEQRAEYMRKARAVFQPTLYVEPFGGTVLEAGLCGTPVVTTDFGAFPETVRHGVTGYRCRTLEQFVWAAQNVGRISPAACQKHVRDNYSLERIGAMYDEYFGILQRLYDDPAGWYGEHERTEMGWLTKHEVGDERTDRDIPQAQFDRGGATGTGRSEA